MKQVITVLISIFLISCTTTHTKIEEAYQAGNLKLGMTKQEVADLGIKPNGDFCVKTSVTEEATWELWNFARNICVTEWSEWSNRYAFIFKNNKLVEIREVESMRDLDLP